MDKIIGVCHQSGAQVSLILPPPTINTAHGMRTRRQSIRVTDS